MKAPLKLFALMFVTFVHAAVAGPVAVIVNSANTQSVTQSDVTSIYSDKTIAWGNGDKIAVYNLPPDEGSAEVFAKRVLGSSARDAAADEANRIIKNTSRNPQQTKRAILVSSIVSKTPGAIGYVPREMADGKPGIRVLFTVE